MTLLRDTFELLEIELLIAQTLDIAKAPLNSWGYADYFWFAYDGHRIQVERKQIGEVLGDINHVEEQLGRELQNGVEETLLLIEGVCSPIGGIKSQTQSWRMAKDKNILVPGRIYNTSYTGFHAWKWQLDKAGVTVVETFDYVATAMALVALYQNSQEPRHKTLRRYVKDRIVIESKNPHVYNLMAVKNGGVGEEIAKAWIEQFGTYWYCINRDVDELSEVMVGGKRVGVARARKFLQALGRRV